MVFNNYLCVGRRKHYFDPMAKISYSLQILPVVFSIVCFEIDTQGHNSQPVFAILCISRSVRAYCQPMVPSSPAINLEISNLQSVQLSKCWGGVPQIMRNGSKKQVKVIRAEKME